MALTVAYNDQQEKGSEGYLRGVHCQRQLAFANQSTVKNAVGTRRREFVGAVGKHTRQAR